MSECNFIAPEKIKPLYGGIAQVYQAAFAGEPWREVSKCVDELQRCVGGLSSLAIGEECELCGSCTARPAYEEDELIERFERIAKCRPTMWYVERGDEDITLAALAWRATPSTIAAEKYGDVPDMERWLEKRFSNIGQAAMKKLGVGTKEKEIIWLDEVFANKPVKPNGNLSRFNEMVLGFTKTLDLPRVAYRTIEPRMITAAMRGYAYLDVRVYQRNTQVPNRRDFVTITPKEVFTPRVSIAMGS